MLLLFIFKALLRTVPSGLRNSPRRGVATAASHAGMPAGRFDSVYPEAANRSSADAADPGPTWRLNFVISALVTLFVVVDPIGLVPTFRRHPRPVAGVAPQRRGARGLIAGAILIGAALIGDWLIDALGISLPAFRIAGGLLLFSIAFEMLFGVRMRREGEAAEQAVEEHVRNIAAFPLAIPLLAGPGAITATVLLAGRADGRSRADRCVDRGGGAGRGRVFRRRSSCRHASAGCSADRQYRAVAAARRATRRARRAIRRRWHTRRSSGLNPRLRQSSR